jgi:hypothetical protein
VRTGPEEEKIKRNGRQSKREEKRKKGKREGGGRQE